MWSSAFDFPGIKSTEPGVARPRFSATRADIEHCTVAKPVLRPALAGKEIPRQAA